jgi:single-stranded-DNA-specific exonuclease
MNGRQRVGRTASHLRFTAYDGGVSVPAIAFRCRDIDKLAENDAPVDLAFQLEVDEWRGRARAQLLVREFNVWEPASDAPASALVEDLFARADEIIAREEYSGIADAPSFHTKLAGVTFEGRQDVLGRLSSGAPLRLVRQPDNEYDPNACALMDSHGDQVGFFNRRLAAALAPTIDAGVEYDVAVTDVTGGDAGRSLGVNVLVTRRDAEEPAEELAEIRAQRRAELSALSAGELDAELTRRFIGDRALHAAQVESLAHLASGERTLAVMATGRGKSLIFHLHAARLALRDGRASVFVYPLRALVADQAYHLEEVFAEVGLSVRTVTGETAPTHRDEAFSALTDGEIDVVLTTPEFLHFHSRRFAQTGRIGFVVVDEAHHVGLARAGHRPAYARIGEAIAEIGDPAVLAVTATASDEVAEQIRATLGITAMVLDPTVRDNLLLEDRRDISNKDDWLVSLVAKGEKVVVYVNSREKSVQIARMLRKRVPGAAMRVAFYNGGLSRSVRHAVERAFRAGEIDVVVSTSAFGEGVNIPDIRHVVLYHLPFNEVEFNQMAGRAGRDGTVARIHLLFGGKDGRINDLILASLAPSRDDMAALYRVLRDIQLAEGPGFEITNAEVAERVKRVRRQSAFDERGVSTALGIFRELGFVDGEGYGAYRRLTFVPSSEKVDLDSSVRYAEGKDEIEQFDSFRSWVLAAEADDLLARFNRPILPTRG